MMHQLKNKKKGKKSDYTKRIASDVTKHPGNVQP